MSRRPDPAPRLLLVTLGGLNLAAIVHVGFAPIWTFAVLLASTASRLLAARRGWALPGRAVLVPLVVLATLVILSGYRTLNGLQAGTALLLSMAALKIQETRAPRDHAALVFIGYFLCLASLLHAPGVLRLVHALVATLILTAALLSAQRPPGAALPVAAGRAALRLLVLAVPLATVLFLFVPRLEGRFWAIPTGAREATMGISPEMNPGAIAKLAQSDEPAFRVRFDGAVPPRAERYWRALVLEEFDGRTWRRPPFPLPGPPPSIEPAGAVYHYTVSLEPTGQQWLPALDHLAGWDHVYAQRMHDDTWLSIDASSGAPTAITAVTNFDATSLPGARIDREGLGPLERTLATKLPRDAAPRTVALARTLRALDADPHALIARVLARFHEGPYAYTLEPPPLGDQPVDEFLFETHAGFCEHYASAFTVLMRAAGIPARVVIGYQGGDLNPYGGYLLVRASHAHAWSEVWLDHEGWIRVDPTAAIAPERIESGLEAALPDAERNAHPLLHAPWVMKAREAYDAVRAGWNRFVVGYSTTQQASLLARLGWVGSPTLGLAVGLLAGFLVAGVGVVLLGAWHRGRPAVDPVARAWAHVCTELARQGCARAPAEGPLAYAQRVARALPAEAAVVAELTVRYVALRYLDRTTPGDAAAFTAAARRYRAPGRRAPWHRAGS